ncbi:hypothetical protein DPMN_119831 [Dreissena polymorpha]|uniref:Uncharacterized protein n=1 Tax=Dreissena polymorpha TaxID=45954 RepID=A0A9D4GJZ1_DREPO|nr:hypothetical protein DPMN_119831 [Dreissena polymorpha]
MLSVTILMLSKTATLPGSHVFSLIMAIFKLVQDIHITNAKHVTSRLNKTPPVRSPSHTQMNRSQDGYNHVFQTKVTILELIQDINGTNHQSKFHEDQNINVASRVLTIRKNAPPPGGHVFQPTNIIFELFHEDRTINVASRVKNAPPLGSHVFHANVTIFELIQDIIETNLLTKANVDVAHRTTDDGQKAITKANHEHVVLR